MATMSRVTIQEPVELPSRGKFPGVPSTITIRAMSLMDEKQRLASSGLTGIVDLIGNCIVKPDDLNVYHMPIFDIDWAMIKLRTISHGPNYKVTLTCPHCNAQQEATIDLDSIPVINVEDDFEQEFEVGPLPISGDTLKIRMLVYKDVLDMQAESKRILSKFPQYKGDPTDVLDYIYKIKEINGEHLPHSQLKAYVESMPAADSIFLDQYYSQKLNKYGPDTNITFICEHCHDSFERSMPMNSEFFRPRYVTA